MVEKLLCGIVCVLSYLVLVSLPVSGIRCFKCDHNEVSSKNNFILSFILQQMSKVDHPECKMKSRRDRYYVDIIECPPPSDYGSEYVCGTVRGTVFGTWQDIEVQFDTLVRDCIQVPAGEGSYHDRCVESAMMDGPTQYLVEEAIKALGDFETGAGIEFKGKTCYDTHGVPVEGHQVVCPTCSFNEILSVNSLLGPLVDALNENNQEACRLQNREDRYHVGYRICKPAYQGEINKCALVEGEVTAKILRGVGGGIDVRYNSVSRGCAQVDMSGPYKHMYKDGCHSKLPYSEPVRKIIVQGFKGASSEMGDITLRGKVCYNNETFSAETPKHKKPVGQTEINNSGQNSQLTLLLLLPAFFTLTLNIFNQYSV